MAFQQARRLKRRRFRKSRSYSVPIRRFGFGPSKLVHMEYNACYAYTVTDHFLNHMPSVRLNNPYDPWVNITGTFNMISAGYTLYGNLYNKNVVLGAKLTLTLREQKVHNLAQATSGTTSAGNSVDSPPYIWGVKADDDDDISGYTSTGWHAILTDPDCRYKVVHRHPHQPTQSKVIIKWSAKKFFGLTNVKDEIETVGANFGSNVTRYAFAIPWIQVLDENTVPNPYPVFNLQYHLKMAVLCVEPKDQSDMTAGADLVQH